jgi:multidrug transporter EmrE-like cation transporter
MFFLLLRVVFTVAFSHLLRLSQARTRRPMAAAAVNYLVGAALLVAWTLAAGGRWHAHAVWLGTLAGCTYVSSLVLLLPAMQRCGVSVTGALLQLSLIVPVGVAIWRFHEMPNAFQTAGIVLTLVALPLLSATRAVRSARVRGGLMLLPVLLFLSAGVSQVIIKEFSATCPAYDLPLYSAALFATSTLCTLLWMAATGDRPLSRAPGRAKGEAASGRMVSEWGLGTLLGLVNVAQLIFLLLALAALPAVVVFPVSAAVGIAFNALVSMALWDERPPAAGWLGIGLAVIAVVLLNLK